MASECRPNGPHRTATIPDIYFGAELEIKYLSRQAAANELVRHGYPCLIGEWLYCAPEGSWAACSDGSLNGGCEIKSPKLKGMEGLGKIVEVARIIKDIGATVDSQCGFHVHIDASDLTPLHLRRILMLWTKHGPALQYYAAPDRRNGRFCKVLPPRLWEACPKRGRLENAVTTMKRREYVNRDHTINIEAIDKHGTIEFRLHEGTLDGDVIFSWIVFLLRLVHACTEIRFTFGDGILPNNVDSLRSLLQKVGLYPAWCYYREHTPEMAKAAKIVRRRFVKWCKEAGLDPDPKEGDRKGPGWKPRRMGA